eukprot:COSAG04_NODE_164_length_21771_cov_415.923219_7_plen_306_part_00
MPNWQSEDGNTSVSETATSCARGLSHNCRASRPGRSPSRKPPPSWRGAGRSRRATTHPSARPSPPQSSPSASAPTRTPASALRTCVSEHLLTARDERERAPITRLARVDEQPPVHRSLLCRCLRVLLAGCGGALRVEARAAGAGACPHRHSECDATNSIDEPRMSRFTQRAADATNDDASRRMAVGLRRAATTCLVCARSRSASLQCRAERRTCCCSAAVRDFSRSTAARTLSTTGDTEPSEPSLLFGLQLALLLLALAVRNSRSSPSCRRNASSQTASKRLCSAEERVGLTGRWSEPMRVSSGR